MMNLGIGLSSKACAAPTAGEHSSTAAPSLGIASGGRAAGKPPGAARWPGRATMAGSRWEVCLPKAREISSHAQTASTRLDRPRQHRWQRGGALVDGKNSKEETAHVRNLFWRDPA